MVKFASTNQKHYPDLRSDASSVWNFCACFSDVVSQENRWCAVKCGLFSKATPKGVMSQGYYFFRSILYWSHYVVPLPVHKMQWRIQGRGLGGPPPPHLMVRMTVPPPPPSEGLDPPLKCSCRVMEKIPNKFFHWRLTLILISFGDFFKFQFMSILSVHSNRQQETVSMPNDSLGPGCSNVG